LARTAVIVSTDHCPIACPLRLDTEHSLRTVLQSLRQDDVFRIAGSVWVKYNYGQRQVHSSNRKTEEITHILNQWQIHRFTVLHASQSPGFRPWLSTVSPKHHGGDDSYWYFKPHNQKKETSDDDLPDDTTPAGQETLAVTNPRWEHRDETMKSNTPDNAHAGDTITLLADISGYVDQGKVTFDIYDTSGSSPQRIDTVYGKNENGTASAEWTVEDPRRPEDEKELTLAFEVHARSRHSERKEIGFAEKLFLRLTIDPNKTESENDTFRLFSTDTAKTYEQTKTIKDDMKPGDNFVDLVFTGLDGKLSYSLEIDEGPEGKKMFLFENLRLRENGGSNG
jgi:hypothetical protein